MTIARTMPLAELLAGHADAGQSGDIVVHGLTLDSRDVRAGDAFVALKGSRQHGITFAPMALARVAAVVLAERPEEAAAPAPAVLKAVAEGHTGVPSPAAREKVPEGRMRASAEQPALNAPTIWIDDLRTKLGAIASRFFGEPSQAMTVIGVTGTN